MLGTYGKAPSAGPSKKNLHVTYLQAPKIYHTLMGSLLSTFPVLAMLVMPRRCGLVPSCACVLGFQRGGPAKLSPVLAFA